MTQTVDEWTQQGNSWFQTGDNSNALRCYYQALTLSGALTTVVKYVQKHADHLFDEQDLLSELLYTKYHMHLVPNALPLILRSTQKEVEQIQDAKVYSRFKNRILASHPTIPHQYATVFLKYYENPTCKEMGFLSALLQEQGFPFSLCDVDRLCHEVQRTQELSWFESSLHQRQTLKLSDIDKMKGCEFEDFIKTLLTKLGYTVTQQRRSHDNGLDLLLVRYGEKHACQVKRYGKSVGNRAVMEAIAAREFYGCHHAMVITNSRFTSAAIKLAGRCNVELWNRTTLKEKIRQSSARY